MQVKSYDEWTSKVTTTAESNTANILATHVFEHNPRTHGHRSVKSYAKQIYTHFSLCFNENTANILPTHVFDHITRTHRDRPFPTVCVNWGRGICSCGQPTEAALALGGSTHCFRMVRDSPLVPLHLLLTCSHAHQSVNVKPCT